jgi:hypothetical protein
MCVIILLVLLVRFFEGFHGFKRKKIQKSLDLRITHGNPTDNPRITGVTDDAESLI